MSCSPLTRVGANAASCRHTRLCAFPRTGHRFSSSIPLEAQPNSSFGLNTRGLGHNNYLGKILNARVYEVAKETPLQHASTLSARTGNTILIKREDLQPVFSFKIRGAHNKIASLSREQMAKGIVACSAGNHAQGVAMSAKFLGLDNVIVMPAATAQIKINGVRKHGGTVRLHGSNYDEAQEEAMRLVREEGRTLIHPFDDPCVIAGQGTIGMEIIKQRTGKELDAIFVCCGGGGMLAGIAAYVKRVRPSIQVIGVEAADAAGMTESLKAGKRVTLPSVGAFADGAAVKTIGAETFRLCNEMVDDMITVTADEICSAIKDGFNDTRIILEPAGALGIAGVKKFIATTGSKDQTFCVIASGANIDFDRLRFISERADATETLLSVIIPEQPGAFRRLHSFIHPRNVTEFSYRFSGHEDATIYLSFQVRSSFEGGVESSDEVVSQLETVGYKVMDLTQNEMAKVHARHLVGGRAPMVNNERLIRFEFPEHPGALVKFLDTLDAGWNVTLFHYRNHGSDVGRVLVGIPVKQEESTRFQTFLEKLGYAYVEESDNAVYKQFLS